MRFSKETLVAAVAAVGGAAFAVNADAAALDTNLVVNGDFENVGDGTGGVFGSVQVLDWSGSGFAYAYSQDYDNIPGGANPAGGGLHYYNGGSSDDAGGGAAISQLIDVSTGDSATLIASGNAFYNLSAFFSSYLDDGDFGNVTARFLDAGGGELGSVTISDNDTTQWTQVSANGSIAVGTATIEVSSFGTALAGNPDGYVDNIDLQVTDIPEPGSLALLGLGGLALLRRRR